MLGIAVRCIGSRDEIALLGAGWHPGRRTGPLNIEQNCGDFRKVRESEKFRHQRDARTACRRKGSCAIPGGTDDDADRSQLILRLHNRKLALTGFFIDPQPVGIHLKTLSH